MDKEFQIKAVEVITQLYSARHSRRTGTVMLQHVMHVPPLLFQRGDDVTLRVIMGKFDWYEIPRRG